MRRDDEEASGPDVSQLRGIVEANAGAVRLLWEHAADGVFNRVGRHLRSKAYATTSHPAPGRGVRSYKTKPPLVDVATWSLNSAWMRSLLL